MSRVWRWSSRLLPNGWFDAVRQLALFAAAYYLYRLVRGVVDGQSSVAFDHARTLVDFERSLGLFFEPGFQSWALHHAHAIVDVGNWSYVNAHLFITLGFLVWLYVARNQAFYFVRNMFMVGMSLALVLYVVYPTAPPRFFPEWGFTDTVTQLFGDSAATSASVLYNPFAAVPSMHVAFALIIGVPGFYLVRNRAMRAFWLLYPVFVTCVVVVTANHFWIDAVIGAMVAGAAAYVASAGLARLRPEAWGWRRTARASITA